MPKRLKRMLIAMGILWAASLATILIAAPLYHPAPTLAGCTRPSSSGDPNLNYDPKTGCETTESKVIDRLLHLLPEDPGKFAVMLFCCCGGIGTACLLIGKD